MIGGSCIFPSVDVDVDVDVVESSNIHVLTYHQWTDHWKFEGWLEDELSTILPGTMSLLYINSLILPSNYYHNSASGHTATHLSTSKLRSNANVHMPLMLCPVQTLCVLAPVCLLRNRKSESKQKSRYLICGCNLRPTPSRHDGKHQPPFPKCTHASAKNNLLHFWCLSYP